MHVFDFILTVKYGDESLRLSYGLKTNVPVVLPYGDLQIWCSIQDNIGGVTMYSAANFSVIYFFFLIFCFDLRLDNIYLNYFILLTF